MTITVDWNEDNLAVLTENAGKISAGEIAKLIPGATRSGVVGKMSRLGLTGRAHGRYRDGAHVPKGTVSVGRRKSTQAGGTSNPMGNRVALFSTSVNERQGGMGRYKLEPVNDIPIDIPNFLCVGVALLDLKKHHCRWPLDDGKFCGLRRWEHNPYCDTQYCAPHHRLGHKPVVEHRKLNPR